MKVTADVINDLLPIYVSGECSKDTRELVEEFLKSNPRPVALGKEAPLTLPSPDTMRLDVSAEIGALKKTRRMLRTRSAIMALAIFFTCVPFSFVYTHGTFYTLYAESPVGALVYGCLGVALWVVYFILKRKSNVL